MAKDQIIVLNQAGSTTEIDLIIAGVLKPRYSLLSGMGFKITLAPPGADCSTRSDNTCSNNGS